MRKYIFIRVLMSFYELKYLWEEFPPELPNYIIVTRRDARIANRDRYSSTLSDIHFARTFVQLIPLTLNAANWCQPPQPERRNCGFRASYRWITLETPFPVRRPFKLVSVRDTLYTLSAIKIKCLYKVNRYRHKTRSAENVNWFERSN